MLWDRYDSCGGVHLLTPHVWHLDVLREKLPEFVRKHVPNISSYVFFRNQAFEEFLWRLGTWVKVVFVQLEPLTRRTPGSVHSSS